MTGNKAGADPESTAGSDEHDATGELAPASGTGNSTRTKGVRSSWLARALSELLFVAIVALVVALMPPFAMEEAAKQQAAAVMQRVLSPWHSCKDDTWPKLFLCRFSAPETTAGQDAVTVVRIDDAWFRMMGLAPQGHPIWPAPVLNLENVIRRVVAAGPRAVFIDIAFPTAPRELEEVPSDRKPTDPHPVDRRAAATELGRFFASKLNPQMPVFIGEVLTGGDRECPDYLDSSDLDQARISDPDFLAAFKAPQAKSTNVHFVDIGQKLDAEGAYQLAPHRFGPKGGCGLRVVGNKLPAGETPWLAAPALALFKAYCSPTTLGAPCSDHRLRELAAAIEWHPKPGDLVSYSVNGTSALDYKLTGDLSLLWGSRLSPTMEAALKQGEDGDECAEQLEAPARDSFFAFAAAALNRPEAQVDTHRCVYINNISAANLWKPFGTDDLLHDRVVIIGATVAQARDIITSPVNGTLPGVYIHAVALENLLSFGSDFHGSGSRWAFWFALIVAIILAIGFRLLAWWVTRHPWAMTFVRWQAFYRMLWLILQYLIIPFALFITACALGIMLFAMSDLPLAVMAGPMLLMALSVIEITQEGIREGLRESLESPRA